MDQMEETVLNQFNDTFSIHYSESTRHDLAKFCALNASALMYDKLVYIRKNHRELWIYFPDIGTCKTVILHDNFTSPMNFGIGEVENKTLYLIGGNITSPGGVSTCINTTTSIDLETYWVDNKPGLNTARRRCGVAITAERYIWAIGGDNKDGCLQTCELYD